MTEKEIQTIADQAVEKTFVRLGFQTDTPIEIQKDIAYLRKSRQGSEAAAKYTKHAVIGVFVSGIIYTIWQGVVSVLKIKGS